MSTQHYKYQTQQQNAQSAQSNEVAEATSTPSETKKTNASNTPTKVTLSNEQTAGHGDHWQILTDNVPDVVPEWLQQAIETATVPHGLLAEMDVNNQPVLMLSENKDCHINQVLAMRAGKPSAFVNAYPCVNSPYGVSCVIERIIANDDTQDGVLRLVTPDGSVVYAFDQMYAYNKSLYQKDTSYFANLSGWAYAIEKSDKQEVVRVEDAEAIRYHRAFNDIVAKNGGTPPADIEEQIKAWQPEDADQPLAPVEINLGHMCAYLFGETLGQEDEAWCQGQVLGKQQTTFFNQSIVLLDVAILREPDAKPLVVRLATPAHKVETDIEVNDYIQANVWLQVAIYKENQKES